MTIVQEFKEFALKGNVMDLAVGVIIGAAFGKIVDSLVKDILMPLVGALGGNIDFSNYFVQLGPLPEGYSGALTYAALKEAGVNLFAWGNFATIVLNFLILAFLIFMMVKQMNRLRRAQAPAPEATPEEVLLLREIRDTLRK